MNVKSDGFLFTFDERAWLEKAGLNENGPAQQYVDSEVIRLCDPFVPFRDGYLRQSAVEHTVIGSGEVKYVTPYARRLHYHPEYKFNEAPMRGAYWFDRAMNAGGKEAIMQGLHELISRRTS